MRLPLEGLQPFVILSSKGVIRFEEAVECFSHAIELDGNNHVLYVYLQPTPSRAMNTNEQIRQT